MSKYINKDYCKYDRKNLHIALSSVIGTIALATAIAVPVTLQQKNKNLSL
nr:hypothetical protein [Mycoplasmopsis bovis]